MKNRAFFSAPLYKENIRRFWPIFAVGLFIYFISGPFILLMASPLTEEYHYSSPLSGEYLVGNLLANHNLGYLMMHLVLPVLASVCVYSYLNRTNSVAAVHSMPFSRRSLFFTNYLSAFTLCEAPLILTFALMLLCGGRFKTMTPAAAASWLLSSTAIVVFALSCAVFACMVSGNGIIATLTGFALNFLAPAVLVCLYGYALRFIWGFAGTDMWLGAAWTSPWLRAITERDTPPLASLIYIIIAIVIALAADVLYHVRKLERCGDSYVFGWMQTLVGFLFAFVICTMTGLLFFHGFGIWAYVIGFVPGFLIGQMIALKTLHIFNAKCLRNLVIFAVVVAVIVAGFALDIFGIEKKVPKASDVKSVSMQGYMLNDGAYYPVTFTEPEQIDCAIALHKEVLDWHRSDPDQSAGYTFTIRYDLKSGSVLECVYSVGNEIVNGENYRRLCLSDTNLRSIRMLSGLEAPSAELDVRNLLGEPSNDSYRTLHLGNAKLKELISALSEDLIAINIDPEKYENNASLAAEYELSLMIPADKASVEEAEKYYRSYYGYRYVSGNGYTPMEVLFSYDITQYFEKTIDWLNAN